MSRQNDLATDAKRLPEIVPSLPESDGAWSEPGPEAVVPPGAETITKGPSGAAIKDATGKLRGQVDQLQDALENRAAISRPRERKRNS